MSIQEDVGQGWRFEPHFSPPEYSDLWLKSGRAFEVDCADSAGYEAYRRIPTDIPAEMAPAVVCVQGYDDASNPGAVLRVEIPAQD